MVELFQPERHTDADSEPWNETAARAAIHEIARDALGAFDAENLWPAHPQDDIPMPVAGLYLGASGVIWALDYLKRCGAIANGGGFAGVLDKLVEHDNIWLKPTPMGANASLLMRSGPAAPGDAAQA
jgi:hypothetical protein